MSNFFIAIAVFLITVIGALFAVPYFIDWNGYRGVFEEEATRLLGREVRVGGVVNLHLLPTPYFRFEKVRIADTSVNLQEPLLPGRQPDHQAFDPAAVPRRGGGQRDRAAAPGAARGAQRQGRLELAELRPGRSAAPPICRPTCADVGQDHRRRAGAARRRRRRAHALRGDRTASCRLRRSTAPTASAAPSARAAREREPRCRHRRAPSPTAPCASRPSCAAPKRDRPIRSTGACADPMGKPRIGRRAHGASADRRPLERSATG